MLIRLKEEDSPLYQPTGERKIFLLKRMNFHVQQFDGVYDTHIDAPIHILRWLEEIDLDSPSSLFVLISQSENHKLTRTQIFWLWRSESMGDSKLVFVSDYM